MKENTMPVINKTLNFIHAVDQGQRVGLMSHTCTDKNAYIYIYMYIIMA